MKEYWFKLQFERHLQFTAVILLQQSHGFVVLIIPCYHAGTIKEANINNLTGRSRTVLFKYFINASINAPSMHSSLHHQWIHQCVHQYIINASCILQYTIKSFINASSMHSLLHLSMHPQCTINTSSMHSLHQMHQFPSFSSSFHHQYIVSAFINASQCINQCIHQCIINAIHQCIINASSILQ